MSFNCKVIDPSIRVEDIQWDTEKYTITLRKQVITLTMTQFRLLYPLRHGEPVRYAELALSVYDGPFNEKIRVMMDKHFDRIRNKLYGTGMYPYSVFGFGYVLLPEVS